MKKMHLYAVAAGLVLGAALSFTPPAEASRNTVGTYALPYSPVQSGTTVSSTWANGTLADIKNEITNSLSRDGYGGMRAPLKVPDGSKPQPSITFTSDPDVGFYLAAAGDLRTSVSTTDVMKWLPTGTTAVEPLVCAKGVTVTNSTSNSAGITTTGTGTGAGLVSTGGATGNGITASAGATSGVGGIFTGAGSGNGVTATAGATGVGIVAAGGTTSGNGGTFTASGSSNGVAATGGSSGSSASTGIGVFGTGGGSGPGVRAQGGSGGGDGLVALGGGSGGRGINVIGGTGQAGALITAGTAATATVAQTAVRVSGGYIAFESTTSPNNNVGLANTIAPKNIVKAWGDIGTPATTPVVADGYNFTAAYNGGSNLRITFASPMASINYAVVANVRQPQRAAYVTAKATTHFDLTLYATNAADGATLSFNGAGYDVHFVVLGAQ